MMLRLSALVSLLIKPIMVNHFVKICLYYITRKHLKLFVTISSVIQFAASQIT